MASKRHTFSQPTTGPVASPSAFARGSKPSNESESQEVANFDRFDFVRFTFADINGVSRSKLVPKRSYKENIADGVFIFAGSLAYGIRSDATEVEELVQLRNGNCALRPVSETLRALPWATNGSYQVGEVLCETFWLKPFRDGAVQDACPRYVARKQLERLQKLGYSLYSAFEPQFMLFHKMDFTPVVDGMDVCSTLRLAELEEFVCLLDDYLAGSKIFTSGFQVEQGAGQVEFSLEPSFGIAAADQMFSFKEAVKELTLKDQLRPWSKEEAATGRGIPSQNSTRHWRATFMTQPFRGSSSNSLHYNHSLWSTDMKKNLFSDQSSPDGLSAVARHWVAGLVKHDKALTALCSPTVNCYQRLGTPWAPEKGDWAVDDRSVAFSVKNYGSKGTHVENRIASAAANPYLVLAATVAAGLDGISNSLKCPSSRTEEKEVSDALPTSLSEALEKLEKDDIMKEALGEEFIRWFVKVKTDNEIANCDPDSGSGIHNERQIYFDFI